MGEESKNQPNGSKFAIFLLIKSFCRGSRGAVFSKSAPLAAGGIGLYFIRCLIFGGELVEFFFKAFGKIG